VNARKFHRQPGVAWLSGPLVVALGVAAHSVSGESIPVVSVLVALTALVSMSASMIAHLRLPGWMVLLLSGLVQQVLHVAFSLFSGVFGDGSTGHGHGMFTWQPPLPSSASSPPGHGMELMLHAHVAAALLAALVIIQWDSVSSRIRSVRQRGIMGGPHRVTGWSPGGGK
jgi:hypothetical protein